jgi:hypothetical protein
VDILGSTSLTKYLSPLIPHFDILLHTYLYTLVYIRSHFNFSVGIRAGTLCLKDLILECDPYLFVTSIFLLHLLSWISLSYLKKIMILSSLNFLLNWIKLFLQKSSKR